MISEPFLDWFRFLFDIGWQKNVEFSRIVGLLKQLFIDVDWEKNGKNWLIECQKKNIDCLGSTLNVENKKMD